MLPRKTRPLLAGAGLTFSLLAGFGLSGHVSAQISGCRSDPAVWLSNNVKVQLSTTVDTDSTNVESIHYDVHVPAGLSVTKVVFTRGPLHKLESLTLYTDDAANTYDSTTVVDGPSGVGVQASQQVVYGTQDWDQTVSANGQTDQSIHTHVQK